jgi:hypothetical protein
MRRSAALVLLASTLLALTGCKSPCRELSELRCACAEPFQRESCIRSVAIDEANVEPTGEDLALCEQKLETCPINPEDRSTCEALETDEGKRACGLAR